MLVLSRKTDERIMIGDDIVVTVLKIQHDQVRIGIEAPKHIDVHREEVYEALRQANLEASASGGADLAALRDARPVREPVREVALPPPTSEG